MKDITLILDDIDYNFPLVFVRGTGGGHFLFGLENDLLKIRMNDFFISKYPVTQILWNYVMGDNPAQSVNDNKPVENVSYLDIVSDGGFLEKINFHESTDEINKQIEHAKHLKFRLPSETEWEYAARGGIYWGDYFLYSGSDNMDDVGWSRRNGGDECKEVGFKKPNQLGIHDMSGNVWEWCLDYYHENTTKIPRDGFPCMEESSERVLRGGCFHNFGAHCTVTKRYQINPEYKDPCIGFRLVLSINLASSEFLE